MFDLVQIIGALLEGCWAAVSGYGVLQRLRHIRPTVAH